MRRSVPLTPTQKAPFLGGRLGRTGSIYGCLLFAVTLSVGHGIVHAEGSISTEQVEYFENRIRPILVEHCYKCHSGSTKSPKGGLRVDLRQSLLSGGDSGPALIPGKPDESLVIQALRYEEIEMPPNAKLPSRVIADFVQWVEMGAPDPRDGNAAATNEKPVDIENHWAFQPIRAHQAPVVRDTNWPQSDVDAFVLERLEREGLHPVDDADRYTWLRRVSFDLTGLPPNVKQVEEFASDTAPDAFERVVDRLLASPAFGERWARHWLDLVGYADQIGTSNNVYSEHGWRYRDYVIDAFNGDKPFDRFVREQIAGDLLPTETKQERAAALTATGFLVLGDLEIVEADKAKLHVDVIDQQVTKVGKAFLAMTVGCARCHDHKFDPIPQVDYYALAGIFHSTVSIYKTPRGVWSDVMTADLPETDSQAAERTERKDRHNEKVAAMKEEKTQAETRKKELDELLKSAAGGESPREEERKKKFVEERDKLANRVKKLSKAIEHAEFFAPTVPRAYSVSDAEEPTDMRITIRGNPRALGESVSRGFLTSASTVKPDIPKHQSGRLQLADWLASRDNPLTARVVVNRIWQKLFGYGLVRSVDYFGVRGEHPSHPELFDHLATMFIKNNWSQKTLIRKLVLSRTYRMSSAHDPTSYEADPDNRLLWRMHRRRLDAEALRDGLLVVTGQLQPKLGGSAMPLEFPENVNNIDPKNVNPPSFSLKKWRPEAQYQRTIYLPILRSGPQPGPGELRNVFDFTQPARFSGQRSVTAVPTQALFLMNSELVKSYAAVLAEQATEVSDETAARLEWLWLRTLNRPVSPTERDEAKAFLSASAEEAAWRELCHAMLASNEFLIRL